MVMKAVTSRSKWPYGPLLSDEEWQATLAAVGGMCGTCGEKITETSYPTGTTIVRSAGEPIAVHHPNNCGREPERRCYCSGCTSDDDSDGSVH